MQRLVCSLLVLIVVPIRSFAAPKEPWQIISNPTAADVAAIFPAPPPEYSAQFTWGWRGPVDRNVIERDLDGMKALGVQAAIIDPNSGMRDRYLSPGYFNLVRVAVEEAKKRNMRLWIMDDGDYPSGMAGGRFTVERPYLCMRALGAPERFPVAGGAHFSHPITPEVICAVAVNEATHATQVLDTGSGRVEWTAPPGDWEVVFARWIYRSGPTRAAFNPTGAKDNTYSLMDYLNPAATEVFKQWTFEGYKKVIGDEFGRTVLGFRGDEPAYNFNPWTPKLLAEFQRRKGYDLRPFLIAFGPGPISRETMLTGEQRRAYADYCDVWSGLFRDSYFNLEGQWCADHGLEMQLHIEHEEILSQLAAADGDYFKCFRNIEVPGIDIIWHQVWMDNPADFPKLASSAAHLYGHPRAMCEAFAAYRPPPDLKQARWLLDFLMAHGINRIEYMFWPASTRRTNSFSPGPITSAGSTNAGSAATNATRTSRPAGAGAGGGGNRYYHDPGFPAVAAYVNRTCYLLGEGRPAAQIGLYIPSSSFWIADAATAQEINTNLLALAHQLIQDQRDFDFVDEQALSSVLKLRGKELVNLSGQGYRAIVVPPVAVISRAALDRLHAFAAAGGRVIFIGQAPPLVAGRNFLTATGPADISWATFNEPTVAVTAAVLGHLPRSDVVLNPVSPLVSYNHRRLRDADLYFIFNSGDNQVSLHATLAGTGSAQIWDASTGRILPLAVESRTGDTVTVPLELEPWSTAIVMIGKKPAPGSL